MPEAERGWTKEFPRVEGFYFFRWNDQLDQEPQTTIYSIACGHVWGFLSGEAQHPPLDGAEWLGPFTSADFEQLAALRVAAKEAHEWIAVQAETWTCQHADQPMRCSRCSLRSKAKDLVAALREALKGE